MASKNAGYETGTRQAAGRRLAGRLR